LSHLDHDPAAAAASTISFETFLQLDVRVGTVVRAERFPEARKPAYKLGIDFGSGVGIRKSSAQITVRYSPEELVGRQVLAVVNFPPRQVGSFQSEVLVLGCADETGTIVLIAPDGKVPDGARLA
jgi:tRNA-binding protein